MGVFLLAFFFTVLLPFGEGVLLALLLREVHLRHPLPLGGRIPTGKSPQVKEPQTVQNPPPAAVPSPAEPAETVSSTDLPPETENVTQPNSSVFDNTASLSATLQIQEVLNAMTAPDPAILPHDMEKRIEASSQPDTARMQERNFGGDMDDDDLAALEAALPGPKPAAKIDFAADIEPESQPADNISPMAKELLGENFDFETLESNALNSRRDEMPAADIPDNEFPAAEDVSAERPAEIPPSMPVQENGSGVVQVLCSPATDILPSWEKTEEDQTVLPAFLPNWVQECDAAAVMPAENSGQFFFTEEMRPMFVRKKKTS
ncbi:MAG: hypothetical protein LBH00_06515 [Planctomycetaceae bacterium]|jgi:hypothetical protein|nr:hypothetical protein [Planctomycetaceae bacterium]